MVRGRRVRRSASTRLLPSVSFVPTLVTRGRVLFFRHHGSKRRLSKEVCKIASYGFDEEDTPDAMMIRRKRCPARPLDWATRGSPFEGNVDLEDPRAAGSLLLRSAHVASLSSSPPSLSASRFASHSPRVSSVQRTYRSPSSIVLRPRVPQTRRKIQLQVLRTSLWALNWALHGARRRQRTLTTKLTAMEC